MDLLSGRADQLGQRGLDPGVQVFRLGRRARSPRVRLLNLFESPLDGHPFVRCEDSGGLQHLGVGPLQPQFIGQQEPILAETLIDRRERRVQVLILFP